MKISLLFTLSYLSNIVYGGGYQECLGRVWMYQAYLIDGLNDAVSQTIGFKCGTWDVPSNTCTGTWTPCKAPPQRCSFDEWSKFLGRAPKPTGWAAPNPNDGSRLDIEGTAKICYDRFITNSQAKDPKVPGPKPYLVMKGTNGVYNDQIKQVSRIVNDAYKNRRTVDNQHLWQDYDDAVDKIIVARAGDHGKHLIADAKNSLGGSFDIEPQNLGTNPVDSKVTWETVDWKLTRTNAENKGVKNADQQIRQFLKTHYTSKTSNGKQSSAQSHIIVMRSFKRAQDRNMSCR